MARAVAVTMVATSPLRRSTARRLRAPVVSLKMTSTSRPSTINPAAEASSRFDGAVTRSCKQIRSPEEECDADQNKHPDDGIDHQRDLGTPKRQQSLAGSDIGNQCREHTVLSTG